jgi:outer membrane protein OmpA-like peptidoglycan-associated protein
MIGSGPESSRESSRDMNIWVSFADVFAGLLLITIVGLVFLLNHRQDENVKFSRDLVQVMNRATETTKQMQVKLSHLLPSVFSQTQSSETQIVIPAGALFASFGFDDYLNDPTKLKLLTDIRQTLKESLDAAGKERKFLRVIIEGHTDGDPVKLGPTTKCIPTNWELSSRRATGVLRFFEEGGMSAQEYNIVAMGLADTQPVAPNTSEVEKSKNRRIVIRVEPDIDKLRKSLSLSKTSSAP